MEGSRRGVTGYGVCDGDSSPGVGYVESTGGFELRVRCGVSGRDSRSEGGYGEFGEACRPEGGYPIRTFQDRF